MKKNWQSKTFWANTALFLGGLATLIVAYPAGALPTAVVAPVETALTLGGAVSNLILRVWFTNTAIAPISNG